MNETIPTGHYYLLTLHDKKVGFICVRRFMHPKAKDIMTISRLVILPEFQGFGIGIKFMNLVAGLYPSERMRITTSLKPFIMALKKNKDWKCVRFGRAAEHQGIKYIGSNNRITATFQKVKHG